LLLQSPIHEYRSLALLILVNAMARADPTMQKQIYGFYLANTRFVNNWDLVDVSARDIVGTYLATRSRRPLYRLAHSASLWERRIAIVATHHFIRQGDFADTLKIAELLLDDREDLIHKAVGWMLREVGKRDQAAAEEFLRQHHPTIPRTALRYAVERFPEAKRRAFLKGTV
ncbi:MAG: DNA alkylation repair protein, partial [Gemmataceae bacterium]